MFDCIKLAFKSVITFHTQHFRIHDSCLSYACKPGSKWTVSIELCVCHDAGPSKELDEKTFSDKHARYFILKIQIDQGYLSIIYFV